ncbi:MAG TPA: hypothetical protein VGM37_03845 [Armatimonadota bacterium]|jgi:hypothetical protein
MPRTAALFLSLTTAAGSIYLIRIDKKLVPMGEQAYDSEALLQSLLADYPNAPELGCRRRVWSALRRPAS